MERLPEKFIPSDFFPITGLVKYCYRSPTEVSNGLEIPWREGLLTLYTTAILGIGILAIPDGLLQKIFN